MIRTSVIWVLVIKHRFKTHDIIFAIEISICSIRVRDLLNVLRRRSVSFLLIRFRLSSQLLQITIVSLLRPPLFVFVVLGLFVQELHEHNWINFRIRVVHQNKLFLRVV
jgi:hypothetical protein